MFLDGNVLGGELGEIFTVDITAATGQCAACGAVSAVGQIAVYVGGPGTVARCPAATASCCGSAAARTGRGSTCAVSSASCSTCPVSLSREHRRAGM